jgi:signal transduction histidine kinase
VDTPAIRILVVEDSELDFELLKATLRRQGISAALERVEDEPAMRAALGQGAWDAVISDHQLPRFSSLQALQTLKQSGLELPFIIVSGTIGEDVGVAAMREGADDYLTKGRLDRLGAALARGIASAQARRERTQAQAALADSEQRLRALSMHQQRAIDDERKAIAREIHDDIGGLLTALRFDLSWIERHSNDQAVVARTAQARQTLLEAMQASQRIMHDLRPPVLEAGVVAALQWQAQQFAARTALPCEFHSNVEQITVSDEASMALYRCAQEALTNIVKHSGARHVKLDLVASDQEVSLEISDDGHGLQGRDLDKPGSFGLRGLTERARAAGGWLEVLPDATGTTVMITLPLESISTSASASASINDNGPDGDSQKEPIE